MFNIDKIRDPMTSSYWLRDQADASPSGFPSGFPVNIITRVVSITGSTFPAFFIEPRGNNIIHRFISSTIGDALATNAALSYPNPTSVGVSAINIWINFAEGTTTFASISCFYQGERVGAGLPDLYNAQPLFIYYSALKQKYYFGQLPSKFTFTTTNNNSISGSLTLQLSSLYSNSYGSLGEVQRLYTLGYL